MLNVTIDKGELVMVETLEEASAAVREYLDSTGLGASEWKGGRVVDVDTGKTVARISYNGRLWEPCGDMVPLKAEGAK